MNYQAVPTVCPYCGVGCNMVLEVCDGQLMGVRPHRQHPVSEGSLCIKGWNAHAFVRHPDRLTQPLKWENDEFAAVGWDTALDEVSAKFQSIIKEHGPDSVGVLVSARCTNEEDYLLMKLGRGVFKTPHIDHCARL